MNYLNKIFCILSGLAGIQEEAMAATVAERIRFWRTLRDVRQEALATHIGVTQGTIAEVERGQRRRFQQEPYLSQMATFLEIPVRFLHANGPEPATLVARIIEAAHQETVSVSTSC
jgi:transcriptional regulator with XRE-family HTH domain